MREVWGIWFSSVRMDLVIKCYKTHLTFANDIPEFGIFQHTVSNGSIIFLDVNNSTLLCLFAFYTDVDARRYFSIFAWSNLLIKLLNFAAHSTFGHVTIHHYLHELLIYGLLLTLPTQKTVCCWKKLPLATFYIQTTCIRSSNTFYPQNLKHITVVNN